MKVFTLKKVTEEKFNMFRSYKDKEGTISLTLRRSEEFNLISLTNPKDSNEIYILSSLKLRPKINTVSTIFIDTDLPKQNNLISDNILDISVDQIKYKTIKGLELDTLKTSAETYIDLLEKEYILMIPGGSIAIILENNIKDMDIQLNYTLESL